MQNVSKVDKRFYNLIIPKYLYFLSSVLTIIVLYRVAMEKYYTDEIITFLVASICRHDLSKTFSITETNVSGFSYFMALSILSLSCSRT